jgi:hypothetical protein
MSDLSDIEMPHGGYGVIKLGQEHGSDFLDRPRASPYYNPVEKPFDFAELDALIAECEEAERHSRGGARTGAGGNVKGAKSQKRTRPFARIAHRFCPPAANPRNEIHAADRRRKARQDA